MKKTLITLTLTLTLALMFLGMVSAQDNESLSVSCFIPEIPGVNAPLIEEEASETEPPKTTQEGPEPEEIMLAKEEGFASLTVKTIYSR